MYKLIRNLNTYAEYQNYPYKGYAIFQLISNAIFYLIWIYLGQQTYDNTFLRFSISLLSIPLILINYWPAKLRVFIPLYWYSAVLYSIMFFFTFMLLKNQLNYMWSLNFLSGIVLWILLLDYKALSYLTPMGIISGFLTFLLSTPIIELPLDNIKTMIVTSSAIFIFGYIFSHRNHQLIRQKLSNLNVQSAAIAHEMRTPLGNINMIGHTLKNIIARYRIKDTALSEQSLITNKDVVSLEQLTDNLRETVKGAQTFIDLMLVNLKQDVSGLPCSQLSMKECIEKIMNIYPFTTQEQQSVHLNLENDFTFSGNEDFFQHVIFNLLKNSFYFIHAAHQGKIFIYTQTSPTENSLIFKDTGPGIEPKKLVHIFKPFHSTRPHGTGIGLAFCKKVIENFGGKIKVESELNVHTTFTISFPQR